MITFEAVMGPQTRVSGRVRDGEKQDASESTRFDWHCSHGHGRIASQTNQQAGR